MKNLLLLGSALLMSTAAFATDTPQTIENFFTVGISPNGQWLVGQGGSYSLLIKNLATGDTYEYYEDDSHAYATGSGSVVSNNGTVIGTTDNLSASYWENGEWIDLKTPDVDGATNTVNSITPDGNIICGNVGNAAVSLETSEIMCLPAVWYRGEDGTFGDPVLLPHPSFDFTGRVPQYITAVSISDDGNVIVGQMQDYTGFVIQPIVYVRNENKEWTYALIHPELTNPNGVEFPEYPGEFDLLCDKTDFMTQEEIDAYNKAVEDYYNAQESLIFPQPEQFMSDDEYDAYMEALNEYYETWENYPEYVDYMTEAELEAYNKAVDEYYEKIGSLVYPDIDDYMTDEEKAEYAAAYAIYEQAYDEWNEKYMAFEDAFSSCLADGYTYLFNNFRISPDGRMAVTTREATVPNDDPMAWIPFKQVYMPVMFNLEQDTYECFANAEDIVISYISEDYTILASYLDADYIYPRRAYAMSAENDFEAVPLEDFVAVTSPENATWMKDNMEHRVPVDIDYDTWEFIYVDFMCSGIPYGTPDLSLIATAIENSWDFDTDVSYFSYIIPTGISGVESVAADGTNAVEVLADGTVVLTGEFTEVSVYNVAGVNVFKAEAPASSVATGLGSGLYIVKAVAANGNVIVKKVAL